MTDPVPEITDLQNQIDKAEQKKLDEIKARLHSNWMNAAVGRTEPINTEEPELSIKKLRIHVAQLENEIARINYRGVKLWRLVTVCAFGCFLGSLAGTLLAVWLR